MPPTEEFPLVEIVTELSNELRHAEDVVLSQPNPPVLQLKTCSIELALTWERTKQGGVDFRVMKLEAGAARSRVQTITLNLAPLGPDPFPMPQP